MLILCFGDDRMVYWLTYLFRYLLSIFYAGATVYLACRSLDRAQHAVDDIVKQTGVSRSQLPIMQLDLASFKSIRSFASSFRESQMAGLILLQRVSIACYAKRCISHRKFCPTV